MSVLTGKGRQELVNALHAASAAEEPEIISWFMAEAQRTGATQVAMDATSHEYLAGKMVALEPDKAEFCHLLCQALRATNVVEVGTSHGVSTVYLADAVEANDGGRVIATEHDAAKATVARRHLEEAGVAGLVDLREGDLRETLIGLAGPIDFVLIDIWMEMARPAIELLGPLLRPGAIVICDNTAAYPTEYADYFEYLHDPRNGMHTRTLPFNGGLEMSVKC